MAKELTEVQEKLALFIRKCEKRLQSYREL